MTSLLLRLLTAIVVVEKVCGASERLILHKVYFVSISNSTLSDLIISCGSERRNTRCLFLALALLRFLAAQCFLTTLYTFFVLRPDPPPFLPSNHSLVRPEILLRHPFLNRYRLPLLVKSGTRGPQIKSEVRAGKTVRTPPKTDLANEPIRVMRLGLHAGQITLVGPTSDNTTLLRSNTPSS